MSRPSASRRSTSRPTAHASGFPPKVLPCSPGAQHTHHVVAADDRRQRQDPAAERLSQQVEVRPHVLVVAREAPTGTAETGLDLVGDEQDPASSQIARAAAR